MALPNLSVNGSWNYATKVALQRHMKYRGVYSRAVDGDFGYYSKVGLQKLLKLHGWYTREVDGDFGYYSKYGLHKLLSVTWGSPYVYRASQAQYYVAPWDARTVGDAQFVEDVTKGVQDGLNRHGTY